MDANAAPGRPVATAEIEVRYVDDDRLFIAEVANLGCWASGPTAGAALAALGEVIRDAYATFENLAAGSDGASK